MRTLLKWYYRLIRKSPADMESVQYWKVHESVNAKITKDKSGSIVMYLEGEKYPIPTFPRGYLLFGGLSKLKHEIKNQIFNESWYALEEGVPEEQIIQDIKRKFFDEITEIAEEMRYDMLPRESMCISMREFHRAWTKVGGNLRVRDIITFIFQEDDSYRNRFQWLVEYFNPNSWWFQITRKRILQQFEYSLEMLEEAEVIGDMKERIRLIKRILMLLLQDKEIRKFFEKFCKEVDWNKIKLSKGDKYHLRGKYFKVDYPVLEY